MKILSRSVPCRSQRGLRWAGYSLIALLVLSIVCFEILDLDGSDAPVPPKTLGIKLVEQPNDPRRGALASAEPSEGAAWAAVVDPAPLLTPRGPQVTTPARATATYPRSRLTLPRAALDDPAA
jgi:hypothetical protein